MKLIVNAKNRITEANLMYLFKGFISSGEIQFNINPIIGPNKTTKKIISIQNAPIESASLL